MSGLERLRRPAVAGLAVAVLSACGGGTPPGAAPPIERSVVERGRAVYNFRCYFCHGYSGDAKTLAATFIAPPPRNFVAETPDSLPLARIAAAVRNGVPNSAMKGFSGILDEADQKAVAAFVFDEFVTRKAPNTRYHTPENGWPNHERYRAAFPFATGEIDLARPWETLSEGERTGRRLFMETCVSCHDRGKPVADPVTWESRPLSYPRHNYDHRNPQVDAETSPTPYRLHDIRPVVRSSDAGIRRGEKIFQDNCAFCHAADGTGKNWIGSFLEPHPRNLTDPGFMQSMTRRRLGVTIREGLPGTSMPAWKDVLTKGQIEDVVAYIDHVFHPLAD